MVCRHQKSGFMGGAHVFPGGKLDDDDLSDAWASHIEGDERGIAERLGEPDPVRSRGLLVAGVRETFEESGVLLASATEDVDLGDARMRLHAGAPFLSLAEELSMRIDARSLTPYARWVTPEFESRRFDTRFYVTAVPAGQQASHDGSETTSAVWLRPADAIDRMRSGDIKLAPPTVRTLAWLANFDDPTSVLADASSRRPPLVRPKVVAGGDGWFLALPGDPEHPEEAPALPGATRMVLQGGAWVDAP
jgi:8-oxo-dGTP pyrophosphatase MutT (NUDIX family)